MAQFTVHRNRNAATKSRFPLLLDVQTDLLSGLGTRVVLPLTLASTEARRATMKTLTPILKVQGKDFVAITPQLAGILTRNLGEPVADLSDQRPAILDALDLLFSEI